MKEHSIKDIFFERMMYVYMSAYTRKYVLDLKYLKQQGIGKITDEWRLDTLWRLEQMKDRRECIITVAFRSVSAGECCPLNITTSLLFIGASVNVFQEFFKVKTVNVTA